MTTRAYVSFAEVKEKVRIADALAVLGIIDSFQQKGDSLTGVCPLPSHKHGPRPNPQQFKVNRKNGCDLWHCFGDCQRGGDVIELVKELTGFGNAHVRFWFAEHFGERLTSGKKSHRPKVEKDTAREVPLREPAQAASLAPSNLPTEPAVLKPLRFRLNLDPDVPYLRERGLTQETIAKYGLGLCTRGLLKGYVAIPVFRYPRAEGENPVAYFGRWPGDDFDEAVGRPRYKWPEGFPKSQVVYGLEEALRTDSDKPLIVVEGPFDVYQLVQAGFPNSVARFGSSLSSEQARILTVAKRKIVLLFCQNAAGLSDAYESAHMLLAGTFVRFAPLPNGQSMDGLPKQELQNLMH